MNLVPTALKGVWVVEIEPRVDERGFFARTYCEAEFRRAGIETSAMQCSISFNARRGTLRGIHFQRAPSEEEKLVRCTRGAIYDVVLDLRPSSETFRQWISVELTADNRRAVMVPRGCGHGFLTLEDETEVFYQISGSYDAERAAGVRWNDPYFAVTWPFEPTIMSEKDATFPLAA